MPVSRLLSRTDAQAGLAELKNWLMRAIGGDFVQVTGLQRAKRSETNLRYWLSQGYEIAARRDNFVLLKKPLVTGQTLYRLLILHPQTGAVAAYADFLKTSDLPKVERVPPTPKVATVSVRAMMLILDTPIGTGRVLLSDKRTVPLVIYRAEGGYFVMLGRGRRSMLLAITTHPPTETEIANLVNAWLAKYGYPAKAEMVQIRYAKII